MLLLVAVICVATTYQRVVIPLENQPQKALTASAALVNTGLPIREIIAMNLFGATSSEIQAVSNHQDIPETNLKLILKGAFSHSSPEQASALIATDKSKRAELYFIDAELPGNATLKEVHPNYVVLNRAGRLEKLLFFRSQGLIDPVRNNVHRSQSQNNNAAPAAYAPPQQATPKNTGENHSQSQDNNAAPAAYVPPQQAAPKNTNKNRSQSQNNNAAPAPYVPPPGHYGPPR